MCIKVVLKVLKYLIHYQKQCYCICINTYILQNTNSGERRGSESKPRTNTGGFTGILPPPPSSLNTRVPPPGVKATSKQDLGK